MREVTLEELDQGWKNRIGVIADKAANMTTIPAGRHWYDVPGKAHGIWAEFGSHTGKLPTFARVDYRGKKLFITFGETTKIFIE